MNDNFAAQTIGVMLIILKERYSDSEIRKMLTTTKVKKMINVLNGEDNE